MFASVRPRIGKAEFHTLRLSLTHGRHCDREEHCHVEKALICPPSHCIVLALSFIVGFAAFVLSGATTDKGHDRRHTSRERATIVSRGEDALQPVRHVRVDLRRCASEGLLTLKSGLQLRGVRARQALRDDRRRLPGLPIAGRLTGAPLAALTVGHNLGEFP
jgi:hypothetical protein